MCGSPREPASVETGLAMLDRALDVLNAGDVASLPAAAQARALRTLERAEAKHTAARARVLAAFAAQGGYEDDGQGSARVWLKWQTRITSGAAAGAVAWMKRLAAHPVIAQALAAGDISPSWARAFCAWNDRLPADRRDDADAILTGAATAGADLTGLAGLAREMYERSSAAGPGCDDGGFDDRYLRLGITWQGAGRAEGDLTPGCAAALSAVLEALGQRTGPEDTRTTGQRRHDALEEACRRLITAGLLPGRAGQSRQLMVHITLAQLLGMPGAGPAEAAWAEAAAQQHGWLAGAEADAACCDSTVVPVVTGQLDPAALDLMTEVFLAGHQQASACGPVAAASPSPAQLPAASACGPVAAASPSPAQLPAASACGPVAAASPSPAQLPAAGPSPLSLHTRQRLAGALLALAARTLAGPGGLAAHLRAGLGGGLVTSASLPLDIGAATETIPAHLRRAAAVRHPHCAFPGCEQPASVCEIHHLIPRAAGGPAALDNLVPLCSFHHLTVIHRWGWTLILHPDGSTTATSPNRTRTLHSHGPPGQAA
jgi:Domain of unknown function (DUF222)/HNH endonuclease